MDKRYLQKRGNTWLVVVEVPKPLRKRIRRDRFMKSLGTDNLAQAHKLKLLYVSEWHRQIEVASQHPEDPEADLRAAALAFQTACLARCRMVHGEQESSNDEELLGVIRDRANDILEEKRPEAAERYFNAATGKATFISDNYSLWLSCAASNEVEDFLVGHERWSMTFGHYSKGERVALRRIMPTAAPTRPTPRTRR
jgi:hypothetical protein